MPVPTPTSSTRPPTRWVAAMASVRARSNTLPNTRSYTGAQRAYDFTTESLSISVRIALCPSVISGAVPHHGKLALPARISSHLASDAHMAFRLASGIGDTALAEGVERNCTHVADELPGA